MKIIDCAQYSAEWWEARRGLPTASEFSRIVTPKKWEYASGSTTYMQELIAELYDPLYGMHDQYVSHAMAKGSYMEPECRRYYEFVTGKEVTEVGFCLDDSGSYGCSPDALVGEDGGLELKHPELKTQVKWLLMGGVPPEHLAQCHGFLLVTGRAWIDFMSYSPPLPVLRVRVEPDEKTKKLGTCLEQFCKEFKAALYQVKALEQPDPTKVLDFGELGTVEVGVEGESYW